MKEKGDFKSKDLEDYERNKEFLIDKGHDYICNTCKKVWYPDVNDISSKRPSCYYRGCRKCREKSFLKAQEYKIKKGTNNYDKLRDEPNTKITEEAGQGA